MEYGSPRELEETNRPLPPRFREASFRVYEPCIARILNCFPVVVLFDPQKDFDRSPVTFAQRLRDAMRSYDRYSWPSTCIDPDVFRRIYPQLVVAERDDGTVAIGTKDALREVIFHAADKARAQMPDVWTLDFHVDPAEVYAVIQLCHRRRLTGVRISIANLPEPDARGFEAGYDIVLEPLPGQPQTYTLL